MKTGQVIGTTTKDGAEATDNPVDPGDFFATICKALGIDPKETYAAAATCTALANKEDDSTIQWLQVRSTKPRNRHVTRG